MKISHTVLSSGNEGDLSVNFSINQARTITKLDSIVNCSYRKKIEKS